MSRPTRTTQPVPVVSPNDVERIVRREFKDDEVAEVLAVLNQFGTDKEDRGTVRVQLAALKLADGNREKLLSNIEAAKRDYRDILAIAEYPEYHRTGFRVRELTDDDQARIIDGDWQQYEGWLRK